VKTVSQQVAAMARRWPQLVLAEETATFAIWFGPLVGLERSHRISIEFGLPSRSSNAPIFALFPVVRVLTPRLILQPAAPDEAPLPHVYFNPPDLTLSPLCLFDPTKGEWSHDDLLAATTVPWAADWLACYEGWLATGRWHGGGRHAANKDEGIHR
jgi:hypothetical protein